jgi:hypothetical protein
VAARRGERGGRGRDRERGREAALRKKMEREERAEIKRKEGERKK